MLNEPEFRLTRQRRVILEELDRHRTHPSADEVFGMVRPRLPKISLGTVYRNLEIMADRGLVRRLPASGEKRRYDIVLADHSHVWCRSCGRVDDVEGRVEVPLHDVRAEGYEIVGYRVEFDGVCPRCRRDRRKNERK